MSHQARLTNELRELEDEYKKLARCNPRSANSTREMLIRIQEIVDRMKAIRNTKTINRPVTGTEFLKQLLYPKAKGAA